MTTGSNETTERRYQPAEIEPKWQALWEAEKTWQVSNGPADHGDALNLPWFLTIANGDNIVEKRNYTTSVSFDGNVSQASALGKTMVIELPDVPASANTDILLGFQETPDQLAYAAAHPDATP